jgi:hypothetical protein
LLASPIWENGARLCPCIDKSENVLRKTSSQMTASVSIVVNAELRNSERHGQNSK